MAERSLFQEVYDQIYDRLIRRELQPGDILDRKVLAEELEVSVSPVVRAMSRLENEGFLEILPRRGTRIRMVREGDFRTALLLRNALECQACRIYCGEPVRRHADRLLALARTVDASRSDTAIDWEAEIAFHRALVELVDSPGYLTEYDRVMRRGVFVLVSVFSIQSPFPPDPTHRWHEALLEDLQSSDPDHAESAMRGHLEAGRERYLALSGSS